MGIVDNLFVELVHVGTKLDVANCGMIKALVVAKEANMLEENWFQWLTQVWDELMAGNKVAAPWWLPHPDTAGFKPLSLAENVGQAADFALSLDDKSRLHVHVFADGRMVVHRDRHDPDAGVIDALLHFFTESTTGKVALGVAAAGLLIGAVGAIGADD